jgi:hypothetical protein
MDVDWRSMRRSMDGLIGENIGYVIPHVAMAFGSVIS